jgi:hypothetical protein
LLIVMASVTCHCKYIAEKKKQKKIKKDKGAADDEVTAGGSTSSSSSSGAGATDFMIQPEKTAPKIDTSK